MGQSAAKLRYNIGEGSETIMGTSFLFKEDGIVRSIWQQMANIQEPQDPGAIPGPATCFLLCRRSSVVEQSLHKAKVAGSNPAAATNKIRGPMV